MGGMESDENNKQAVSGCGGEELKDELRLLQNLCNLGPVIFWRQIIISCVLTLEKKVVV